MGFKNRIKINTSNAQISNIRKLFFNSLKVAAKIIVVPNAVHLLLFPKRSIAPISHHTAFRNIFLRSFGIKKPVRKYLIHYSALQKVRSCKIFVINSLLKIRQRSIEFAPAVTCVFNIAFAPRSIKHKMIKIKTGRCGIKMEFPIFKAVAAHSCPKHIVKCSVLAVLCNCKLGCAAFHISRHNNAEFALFISRNRRNY